MCAYHFHCTNGGAIVADLRGVELHDVVAVRDHAAGTARDVLEIYPQSNPSDWLVTVQDCAGYQVAVLTFPELLRGRAFA